MKRGLKIALIIICGIILVLSGTSLGLYSAGYMGFEDGKLRFYFDKDVDDPSKPDTPSNPDDPDEPDEPDTPISTKYTINLVFPDGKTEKYTYNPAKEEFNANSYYTNWISAQEKTGGLYRFDNWYLDELYHDAVDLKKLKDGDTLYAKMVEQVVITIHEAAPQSSETKTVAVDKNSIFKIENYITSTEAGIVGIYSDEAKTIELGYSFIAKQSQDIYILWFTTPYSSFTWDFSTGDAVIVKYIGTEEKVIIPKTVLSNNKLYNVTKIGNWAFGGCEGLTSVTIPDSVISIDHHAFRDCTSLTSVTIGNGVISIDISAFNYCTSLTDITIGTSLTSIGSTVFSVCTSLTSVTIKATTPPTFGWNTFYDCHSLTDIYVPAESVDAYRAASGWSDYADLIKAM